MWHISDMPDERGHKFAAPKGKPPPSEMGHNAAEVQTVAQEEENFPHLEVQVHMNVHALTSQDVSRSPFSSYNAK